MKYEIKYKPSYSMLVVNLEPNEKIVAESGAMTYMAVSYTHLTLPTKRIV